MRYTKKHIAPILIILSFIAGIAIYNTKKGNKRSEELNKEYPRLQNDTYIHGKVQYKYDFKKNRYRDILIVSKICINDQKYTIIANEIEGFNDYGINEVIEVGDFMSKKKHNDTIVITKKDGEKCFFLRRDN